MNQIAKTVVPSTLEYGEVVSFGVKGTVSRLETKGLDLADGDHHTWTMLPTAELEFGLRLPADKVELRLEAAPFLQGGITSQQVFIYLNGLFVSFISVREQQVFSVSVDRATISSRQNRLSLVIPTATSPHALGLSTDRRELGIVLTSLCFRGA
jgi:hypothetical protein